LRGSASPVKNLAGKILRTRNPAKKKGMAGWDLRHLTRVQCQPCLPTDKESKRSSRAAVKEKKVHAKTPRGG